MDPATLGQYSGYIALLISMGTIVLGIVNHKKLRSTCCGHEGSISLDISPTTPISMPPVSASQPPVPLTVSGIAPSLPADDKIDGSDVKV